ncbi:MAG: metalloregulator ArsR/SmtB family transcription factor [Patescibacteria group bacterium]|jgi:ArsR family transcriptional regulator
MKPLCCSNKELTKEFANLAKFLRLIGEENRLKIICILKDGERCVCEIEEYLDLPQNLVSAHLKALKNLKLVESRQEWKRIYYSIDKKTFKKYNSLLTNFLKNYI